MAVFEVDGGAEVARLLAAAGRSRGRVGGVLGDGVDRMRDTARGLAQSRGWSAATVGTIQSRRERRGRSPAGYVFIGGAGFYQEVGTVRHGPNPVLQPAFDMHVESVVTKLTDIVGSI